MRVLVRLIIVAALAWGGLSLFWKAQSASLGENADPTRTLALFAGSLLAAAVIAVLIALTLVPAMGEWMGNFFFNPGEETEKDPHASAVAKIAQGDYAGAIAEYQAICKRDPSDTFALSEIARIYCEKLGDPESAAAALEQALEREWPQDQGAFLANRLADVYWHYQADAQRARALFAQIAETMPETKHAANAQHRVREIDAAAARGELPTPPMPKEGPAG